MAYENEKIINAIIYIAKIHLILAKKPAYQTYIYKYVALIDFAKLKEFGKPMFDLNYVALKNGPVPIELYDNRENLLTNQSFLSKVVLKKNDDDGHIYYEPTSEADLDFFSNYEIELIEKILEKYAHPGMGINELCDATHNEILAWKKSWNRRNCASRIPIDPLYTFKGIRKKSYEQLTPEEEVAITHYSIKKKVGMFLEN